MSTPSTILPPPTPAEERRFQHLAANWKASRGATSSLGMGPAAVPLLLRELEREPDHWFWALKAITGTDPVLPEVRGRIGEMAVAWIRWGRDQGYSW